MQVTHRVLLLYAACDSVFVRVSRSRADCLLLCRAGLKGQASRLKGLKGKRADSRGKRADSKGKGADSKGKGADSKGNGRQPRALPCGGGKEITINKVNGVITWEQEDPLWCEILRQ